MLYMKERYEVIMKVMGEKNSIFRGCMMVSLKIFFCVRWVLSLDCSFLLLVFCCNWWVLCCRSIIVYDFCRKNRFGMMIVLV